MTVCVKLKKRKVLTRYYSFALIFMACVKFCDFDAKRYKKNVDIFNFGE